MDLYKSPRLYVNTRLSVGGEVALSPEQAHYLRNVLRMGIGSYIRVFNAQDGEWQLSLTHVGKKEATGHCDALLRPSCGEVSGVHLFFAPIKKARFDFLIEKSVELGVTDLHPVLTAHTEVRKLNMMRLSAQIIEAAEQCERLDIPRLHDMAPLYEAVQNFQHIPLIAAIERQDNLPYMQSIQPPRPFAALVGPEGGFNEDEVTILSGFSHISGVSLGANILRAETAAIKMLSCLI